MHGSIQGLSYLDCLQSHSCVSKIKIDKGYAIKAIKLWSQYFTAVECFAQFYRIISFFALRKWYRNRCFVWDLSTLFKAQCGRFSRYVQLPWQQRLLLEIRMPDQHQSFLFQRCFSRTNISRKLFCFKLYSQSNINCWLKVQYSCLKYLVFESETSRNRRYVVQIPE